MKTKSLHELPVYIFGEEIPTCPMCGSRTDFEEVDDHKQQHKCLNKSCGHEFFVEFEEDQEFTDEYSNNLLHAVLNQIETDLEEQDYTALDEMLQELIKDENAKDILWNYLGDDQQTWLNENSVDKRY